MYEEKVLNGVLSYRASIAEEWTPFTSEQLTSKLMESRQKAPVQWPTQYPFNPLYYQPNWPTFPTPTQTPPTWTVTCGTSDATAQLRTSVIGDSGIPNIVV